MNFQPEKKIEEEPEVVVKKKKKRKRRASKFVKFESGMQKNDSIMDLKQFVKSHKTQSKPDSDIRSHIHKTNQRFSMMSINPSRKD